jgi:hypothetical protein
MFQGFKDGLQSIMGITDLFVTDKYDFLLLFLFIMDSNHQ